MSDARSCHDEPAMDDSIDAESFRNGSIGSGSGHPRTHGSYISSNASRAASRASVGPPTMGIKLGSPFVTPSKPRSKTETGSFVEVAGGPPPSAVSRAYTGHTGRSEGESGVLVSDCNSMASTVQKHHDEGSIFGGEHPPPSGKWLRPAPVAYEGSPLPRDIRNNQPDWSRDASFPGGSRIRGGTYSHNTEPKGWGSSLDSALGWGGGAKPSNRTGSQCQRVCCRPPQSPLQAHSLTSTPRLSMDDAMKLATCGRGCWGQCDGACRSACEQYRPSSPVTPSPAQRAWPGDEQIYHSARGSNAGTPYVAESVPTDVFASGRTGSKFAAPSHTVGPKTVAPGLSQIGGATEPANYELVGHTANLRPIFAERERQAQAVQEEKEMEAARPSLCGADLEVDVKHGLGNLEQRMFERLDMLEKKIGQTGHGKLPAAQVGSAMNNMASVTAGDAHGYSASRNGLDVRDLNKQVLKMNLYEKFKRERDLTDRLARIEEKLITKPTPTDFAMTPAINRENVKDLRYQLMEQRQEINMLKQDLSLMPEVRGEVANLSNAALWTHDRVNKLEINVENLACQQQNDMQDGLPNGMYGPTGYVGGLAPQATATHPRATSYHTAQSIAQSNSWAARSNEGIGYAGWGDDGLVRPDSRSDQHNAPSSRGGSAWGGRGYWSHEAKSTPRGSGWDRSPSVMNSLHRRSPQPGRVWGGDSQIGWDEESFVSEDGRYENQYFDQRSMASGTEYGYGRSAFSSGPYHMSGRGGPATDGSVPSTSRMFDDFVGFAQGVPTGARSVDSHSRAPTVETILDEDEFKPFASRTQYDSGPSWAIVSSRPQTDTNRTSFQTLERPSSNSDDWTQISSTQHSQARTSKSPSTSSIRPANAHGGLGSGHYGPPTATWTGVNPSWASERGGRRNSSKPSREHWNRPTTPSKWEGQEGRGSDDGSVGGW